MNDNDPDRGINIFKPQAGVMRGEVRVIVLVMSAWFLAVVGSQVVIWFLENSLSGFRLNELVFFNLPISFWLTGQFLPLWFILLGGAFNLWMDRHESRRLEGTIRLRTTGRRKGEQQP